MGFMDTIAADLEAIRTDANAPTESVTYTRYSGGSVVTGFPKTIAVFCPMATRALNEYQDGLAQKDSMRVTIGENSVGSCPEIDADRLTRSDGSVWAIRRIIRRFAGQLEVECERTGLVERGARGLRLQR